MGVGDVGVIANVSFSGVCRACTGFTGAVSVVAVLLSVRAWTSTPYRRRVVVRVVHISLAVVSNCAMPFRLAGLHLFLTYPQCPAPPGALLGWLRFYCNDRYKWAAVVQERHEDGHLHLHAIVVLSRRIDIENPRALDFHWVHSPNACTCAVHHACDTRGPSRCDGCRNFHGQYEVLRSPKNAMQYLQKEGEMVFDGITKEEAVAWANGPQGKKRRSDEVAQLILGGHSVMSIAVQPEFCGFALFHLKNMQRYEDTVRFQQAAARTPPRVFCGVSCVSRSSDWYPVAVWCNGNLGVASRPFGRPQLWVYGPTKLGKTSLVNMLRSFFRVYDVPMDEDFYDEYDDRNYDIISLDEMKGQKTIQFMNRFVDGSFLSLRKKGCQGKKESNHPVIVTANYSISDIYHKSAEDRVETLKRRFIEVYVNHESDLLWHESYNLSL